MIKFETVNNVREVYNAWAGLYVRHLNDLYGQWSEEERFFEEQLRAAEEDLQAAEAALVAYQTRNLAGVLQTRMEAKQAALSRHLHINHSIELVIQDTLSLKERLRLREGGETGSLADDLAPLLLELDTLSGKDELPIEVQIAGGQSVSNRTVKEQIAFLDDLVTRLRTKKKAIEEAMEALPPEILALQGQLEEARAEERRLQRERELAEEVYQTL